MTYCIVSVVLILNLPSLGFEARVAKELGVVYRRYRRGE